MTRPLPSSAATASTHAPARHLGVLDGVAVLVGMVVGVGIFKAPALVAANSGSDAVFLALWLAGAVVSFMGALCYAELATAVPDAGGEYSFLTRAWGRRVGFLFAWGRLAVIQTGAIALVAFVFGDYAGRLLPLGPYGSAIYAALAVIVLTATNLRGTRLGASTQKALTGALLLGILLLALSPLLGGWTAGDADAVPTAAGAVEGGATLPTTTVVGFAMIFVLLTFGGWNEASYLAGELRDVRRTMVRVLAIGIGTVTAIYLALNLAYVTVLGRDGLAAAETVATDLALATFGPIGATAVTLLVVLATLSTLNATIFTGARASYALGRDFPALPLLGSWDAASGTPRGALLVQGAIALALVSFGAGARDSFRILVEFTSPVFWTFLLLVGAATIRLRLVSARDRAAADGFRMPLYPVPPLLFCAASLYMVYSSLDYTGVGAWIGVAALLLGVPVLIWLERRRPGAELSIDSAKPGISTER